MALYFAYGSNMDEMRMKERLGCEEYAIIGKGVLKGYTLESNKANLNLSSTDNPNIVQNKDYSIDGMVFELNDKNITKLDFSMGLVSGHSYRKPVQIETEKGMLECYIYVATKLV